MASNLVVVALPALDDEVNSVSSEKAAHLTILFLGDALSNPNVAKIIDYVKTQAAYLEPFALRVDHRGFLGEDEADVLFFSKELPWQLIDFRSMLLGNQEIAMAYNSIQQYPDWTPHLTLGYPESPANKDTCDPMGTQYVSFDRVAVWYGDSEGTEIPLTPNPKPSPSPEVAAWGQKAVENALEHYGVKGMRWGVRRRLDQARAPQETSVSVKRNRKFQKAPKVKGGSNLEPTGEAITAAVAQRKIAKSGVQSLTNAELRTLNERMNLEQNYSNLVQKKKQKGRGQKFAENQLEQFAGQQVQKTLSDPARIKRGYDYIKLFRSLPLK